MLHVKNLAEIPHTDKPVVLAMGCFDGVHIGHQKVVSTAVEQAEARGGEAWVFTFHPHPAKILSPETAPPLISAEACRLRQFEALGVHGVIAVPFDQTFAHTEPEQFLFGLWKKLPTLSGIVCGTDWSFGYKARGKFQSLEKLCGEHGITATAVPPVLCNGERISSTHIRQAVQAGDIPLAEKMLGRPFCIFGTVVKGRGIGRGLGFPTANIDPENELIPAPGVYAAYTRIQRTEDREQRTETTPSSVFRLPSSGLPSAVFIGERKTFNDPAPVIESYLLDFDGNLYGQQIEIRLVKKIRAVEPFPSKEALIAQIEKDIAQIRGILAGHQT
ncbi:MAG: riboflavin biosynthesis protein RibF [Kiritimatiellaceae bacterium]|nr:riboflavin biosynthesis protein RibF [Kiritimatiellaceae bacterium]